VQACEPILKKMVRELTCDDCKLNMNDVRRHLTNDDQVRGNFFSSNRSEEDFLNTFHGRIRKIQFCLSSSAARNGE
jgi:hypothetical protein